MFMDNQIRQYPAKILLIGEYSVLLGGKALSIPHSKYCSHWESAQVLDQSLLNYLEFLEAYHDFKNILDTQALHNQVQTGLQLRSNIPFGYGLGSSGNLVAAIYDRFSLEKTMDILELKNIFSRMESYFHGKSSGLDPLVSYLNQSLLADTSTSSIIEQNICLIDDYYTIQLIESGKRRNTQQCVEHFNQLISSKDYKSEFENTIMKYNEVAIKSLLNNKTQEFIQHWKNISNASLSLFKDLIPDSIFSDWKVGLESDQYYYKLCGAGGGGFFLRLKVDALQSTVDSHQ
jgi:mevalonate kinase